MNKKEAQEKALAKARKLQEEGIIVEINERDEDVDDELSKRYEVHFQPIGDDDLAKVFRAEEELHEEGITFDTGTGMGVRDWELDWSINHRSDT